MSRLSYGPQVKQRAKLLFAALLAYANDEIENSDRFHSHIQIKWKTETQLIVGTKLRFLEQLIALYTKDKHRLNTAQIQESINRCEDFLQILEDNRLVTQGAEDWYFTLKFWYKRQEQQANLNQFDIEWERLRSDKSKQVAPEKTTVVLQPNNLDWGEAPDIVSFYGRIQEINQLEQWILQDRCKVVALLGLGGIGKTTLTVKLVEKIQSQFDCLVWRSLKSAPSIQEILTSLLHFFSRSEKIPVFQGDYQDISLLINYLEQRRCLIILDEIENIFCSGEGKFRHRLGQYQHGYEDYGELLKRLCSGRHNSCIVLTSREKPGEIAAFEGEKSPVRSLQLRGLETKDAKDIFKERGFSGSENGLTELIHLYSGNPLALKMITTVIQEIFNNNIAQYLSQNTLLLGDRVRMLLKQQIERLSDLEKELVYWLAIECNPVSFSRLCANLLLPPSPSQLMEAIGSLERRSLIEKSTQSSEILFTLPPLVMKYVAEEFVEQAINEIEAAIKTQNIEHFKIFSKYRLNQSSTCDKKFNFQIITRLKNSLQIKFGCAIAANIAELRSQSQGKSVITVGYLGANLQELLKALENNTSLDDIYQDE